jgi:hypothetical protein
VFNEVGDCSVNHVIEYQNQRTLLILVITMNLSIYGSTVLCWALAGFAVS